MPAQFSSTPLVPKHRRPAHRLPRPPCLLHCWLTLFSLCVASLLVTLIHLQSHAAMMHTLDADEAVVEWLAPRTSSTKTVASGTAYGEWRVPYNTTDLPATNFDDWLTKDDLIRVLYQTPYAREQAARAEGGDRGGSGDRGSDDGRNDVKDDGVIFFSSAYNGSESTREALMRSRQQSGQGKTKKRTQKAKKKEMLLMGYESRWTPPVDERIGCGQSGLIPRILHTSWPDRNIPQRFKPYLDACYALHPSPTFQQHFYTHSGIRRLVKRHFPHLLDAFDALDDGRKDDVGRAVVVWVHGGVYMDMAFDCVRSIEDLLDHAEEGARDIVLGQHNPVQAHLVEQMTNFRGPPVPVSHALIAASPRHPLLLTYINATMDTQSAARSASQAMTMAVEQSIRRERQDTECSMDPALERLGSVLVVPYTHLHPEVPSASHVYSGKCRMGVNQPGRARRTHRYTFDTTSSWGWSNRSEAGGRMEVLSFVYDDLADKEWAVSGCGLLSEAMRDPLMFYSNETYAVLHYDARNESHGAGRDESEAAVDVADLTEGSAELLVMS
ncbi:unnamed protein product [Vitrella brassicaformis CCMP3155]|uniref:Uncharacterized protein n=2 Tax=Vitrella brassicaformis TaxID=1169539 RepID=A0A0G4EML1_VITBC|nr:unnamed protein product [Vitrella brassicaformis CCMP3155]|eukprot:CEL98810.1 unnamed protein product [Vitrella brassicaformis CCMP3155]